MREEVCRTAEEALVGTGRNTAGCPYLDYWFHHYGAQTANRIEKALLRYAPAAAKAASAQEYIAIAAERARLAVMRWVRTGEIDAPKEAMAAPPRRAFSSRHGRAAPNKRTVRRRCGNSLARRGVAGRCPGPHGIGIRTRLFTRARACRCRRRQVGVGLECACFHDRRRCGLCRGNVPARHAAGDALIAHELAHVVQQAGAGPESGSAQVSGAEYRALEDDADRAATGVVASLWSGARLSRARPCPAFDRASACKDARNAMQPNR